MKKIIKLALRNLTRSKKRSVILAIAIAFGFFIVTGIDGLASGAVGNLEEQVTQLAGGTVLIGGYEKVLESEATGKYQLVNIIRDKNYLQNLVDEAGVDYKYVSRYTSSAGQLLFNGQKVISTLYGRDFNEDKYFTESLRFVSGSIDCMNKSENILISEQMAENLKLEVGDQVLYTTTTVYGQNNVADFTVGGIIEGSSFFSGMIAYANIETVNALVEIPEGGYSTFTIFLKNKNKQSKVANKLEAMIREDGYNVSSRAEAIARYPSNPGRGIDKQFTDKEIIWEGTKYGVETLNDEIPAIQTVMNIVHIVTTVILVVILLIVMIGISNTYRMVLYERIREIGTMRALGMSGKDTGKVFTTEALILSILGACAGLLLAVLVMLLLGLISIKAPSVQMFLHNGHMSFQLSVIAIIVQYLLMIILTALAVRGTAKKAAHMSPAVALRTVK